MLRVLLLLGFAIAGQAATFGTVTPLTGGVVDMVLDSTRQRLYLVGVPDKVEVYSIPQRRFLTPIRTDSFPLAAAISRDGRTLYVACHNASTVNVIDLEQMAVVNRINLPSRPEGIAVGGDGRVLITTIGTGVNNSQNTLLLYDPAITDARAITSLTLVPPPPAVPGSTTTGQLFQANRSYLSTSSDGRFIVGVNIPNATTRAVFVFEVASATLLRSRSLNAISSVLSVSPDGTRFMSGLNLFESDSLAVLGQQSIANARHPIAATANLALQPLQGGSVFSPDGRTIYSAFNVAPQQNPPARANISQLHITDADNLSIQMALQMPENLSGKLLITPDGNTIFGISESGFVTIPIGSLRSSPLAVPDLTSVLLSSDQCGVTASLRRATVLIRNTGSGRLTASAQPLTLVGANNPSVQSGATGEGPTISFTYNSAISNLGTTGPLGFLLQSNEAVNIPNLLRVSQNNRDAESRGDIIPIDQGIQPNEGLVDIAYDSLRRRIYIANSGLNRIEVFDERSRTLLDPIKVGQLPRSLAVSSDSNTLYVANSASEYITVIDLATNRVSGRLVFPPIPLLSNLAPVYPSQIAATQRGLLVLMNNGTLWTSNGNQLVPRPSWSILGTAALPAPRTMAATPGGEYVIVLNGTGTVYLYDAIADDIVQSRQVLTGTQLQGYYGPIAAGPRGSYYVVNGIVLNQSLTTISTTTASIAAVAAVGANQYARFNMPARTNPTAPLTATPAVELVNTDSGAVLRRLNALEGPLANVVGTQRGLIDGRTMVVDAAVANAYVLSSSGLSVINLEPINLTDRPVVSTSGTVSMGSYTTDIAAGGLVSIFGRNFGGTEVAQSNPLPTVLGGVCVTLNNTPLPLFSLSPGQINVQIPFDRPAGSFPLVVRDTNRKLASVPATIRIARAAPAVLVDTTSGQTAIFDDRGRPVNRNNPTTRDRRLTIYAVGLGPTQGARVPAGAQSTALETADTVKVFFGDKRYSQAEMIVEWAGLTPGFVGLYQINIYVPGDRLRGDDLDVTIRVGAVENTFLPAVRPSVAVE